MAVLNMVAVIELLKAFGVTDFSSTKVVVTFLPNDYPTVEVTTFLPSDECWETAQKMKKFRLVPEDD